MGRRPGTFKETDVRRALSAARKAGLEIAGVKLSKNGDIVILAGKPSEANDANDASQDEIANPWDEIKNNATNKKRTS
jgi:hypothetical protein